MPDANLWPPHVPNTHVNTYQHICAYTYILKHMHTQSHQETKTNRKNLLLYKVQQGGLAGALWTGPGLAADSPTLCLPYGHITGRYLVLRTPVTYCSVFPLQQVN